MPDVDIRNPRVLQGGIAALLFLGFAPDWRPIVVVGVVALVVTLVLYAPDVRRYARTWAVEVALLLLAALLFVIDRGGWAWLAAMIAAGVAVTAAIADVWIRPAIDLKERAVLRLWLRRSWEAW